MSFLASYEESVKLQQSILNTVMQSSTASCISSCEQDQDINIVAINSVLGTLDISQRCQVMGNSCLMKVSLDSTVDNIQKALIKQAESIESDLTTLDFGLNSNESVTLNQAIRNQVSQIVSTNCKSDSKQTKYTNITLINTKANEILLSQDSAVDSNSCSINNALKSYVKNEQTAKIDQSIKKYGMLAIIAAIIIMVVIGIIVVVVVHGGVKVYSAKKSSQNNNGNNRGGIRYIQGGNNNQNNTNELIEMMEFNNLEKAQERREDKKEEMEREDREIRREEREDKKREEREEDERRMRKDKERREKDKSNKTKLKDLTNLAAQVIESINKHNGNKSPIKTPIKK